MVDHRTHFFCQLIVVGEDGVLVADRRSHEKLNVEQAVRYQVRQRFGELASRPQMLADVSIKAGEQPAKIVVPSEAVVRSGEYNQIFVMTASVFLVSIHYGHGASG